jgi:hypothetical protein
MSIMHMDSGFRADQLAGTPASLASAGARTTLSLAAAKAARSIEPRIVSAAALAALARLADFAILALTGLAIFRLYVAPIDGFGFRYLVAAPGCFRSPRSSSGCGSRCSAASP